MRLDYTFLCSKDREKGSRKHKMIKRGKFVEKSGEVHHTYTDCPVYLHMSDAAAAYAGVFH